MSKRRLREDGRHYKRPVGLSLKYWILHNINVNRETGCWEWARSLDSAGYGLIRDTSGPRSRLLKAHRALYEIEKGPIPQGLICCHKCDNPKCCNPDHIFLGTYKDNTQDAVKKKRMKQPCLKAEKSPVAKLTNADVLEIRERYRTTKDSAAKISKDYGVGSHCIQQIVAGVNWRSITGGVPVKSIYPRINSKCS